MSHPRSEKVGRAGEDLGLALEATKRNAVNDPRTIPLKRVTLITTRAGRIGDPDTGSFPLRFPVVVIEANTLRLLVPHSMAA
jgi:hypothetical protein